MGIMMNNLDFKKFHICVFTEKKCQKLKVYLVYYKNSEGLKTPELPLAGLLSGCCSSQRNWVVSPESYEKDKEV